MAQQHIYTSASKLLDAGRSGFGTVARSKSLSPLLVSAIERVSQFANIRGTDRTRVIFVHRRITAANNRVHILTRIADAGADYTGRTNHIAHHLIVTQEEMTRAAAQGITPADVLMQFPWLERWDGAARFFGPEEDVSLTQIIQPRGLHSSRATWAHITGNPSHARLLSWEGAPRNGVLIVPRGVDPLGILAEALAEFGTQSWSRTFTTSLESTDEMSDLDWVISSPDTFHEIESRCGARTRFDLANPQSLPVPPEPAKVVEAPAAQLPELSPQPVPTPHTQTATNPAPRVEPLILQKSSGVRVAGRPQVKAAPVKKNNSSVLGIAAGFVGALIIVALVYVIKNQQNSSTDSVYNSSTDSKNETTSSVPDIKEEENKAINKLINEGGISDDLASKFVNQTSSDLAEWTSYACELIKLFKSPLENPANIGALPDPPNGKKPSSIKWLDYLGKAKINLESYSKIDAAGTTNDRMKFVTEIHQELDEAVKMKILAEDSADKFCSPLIKYALNQHLKNTKGGDEVKLIKQYFNSSKNPSAYNELQLLISADFKTWINSSLVKEIHPNSEKDLGIPEQDIKSLRHAFHIWNHSSDEINHDTLNIGKGFIPANFEVLLNEHRKSQGTPANDTKAIPLTNEPDKQPEKFSGHDMTDVEPREIIIVSAQDLKNGVPVKIIGKIFEKHFADKTEKVEIAELTIKFNPSDPDNENNTWILSDDKDFYRRKKVESPGMLALVKNGNVIYDKADIDHLVITYTQNKKEYICYIVVDNKSKVPLPFISNLAIEYSEKSEDLVTLGGQLKNWISNIKPKNIIIKYQPDSYEGDVDPNKLTISKPKQNEPVIIISEKDKAEVTSSFNEYKEIKIDITKNDKDKVNLKKDKLRNLKENLHHAIGTAWINKNLDIKNDGKIDKAYRDRILDICKQEKISYNKNDDWEKELKSIKDEIGENKLDQILTQIIKKDWKSLIESESAMETSLVLLFNRTKQPTPYKSPAEVVTSITVSTTNGRVLFTAKKQP